MNLSRSVMVVLVLMVILGASAIIYIRNSNTNNTYKPGIWPEADQAVAQAQYLYNKAKDQGVDFKNGPCLSNALIPGWVLDLAHNPREPVDDLPENQCKAYLEGSAKHFVEMDLKGNILRVK